MSTTSNLLIQIADLCDSLTAQLSLFNSHLYPSSIEEHVIRKLIRDCLNLVLALTRYSKNQHESIRS